MTRKSALLKLLAGGHVDQRTRKELGIGTNVVLRYNDLVKLLTAEVKAKGKFPFEFDGSIPQDGMCIVRKGWHYVIISCRTRADCPMVEAERSESWYFFCASAVRDYMRWNLNLPGSLDGIKVI